MALEATHVEVGITLDEVRPALDALMDMLVTVADEDRDQDELPGMPIQYIAAAGVLYYQTLTRYGPEDRKALDNAVRGIVQDLIRQA